jgi:hypothetical protein
VLAWLLADRLPRLSARPWSRPLLLVVAVGPLVGHVALGGSQREVLLWLALSFAAVLTPALASAFRQVELVVLLLLLDVALLGTSLFLPVVSPALAGHAFGLWLTLTATLIVVSLQRAAAARPLDPACLAACSDFDLAVLEVAVRERSLNGAFDLDHLVAHHEDPFSKEGMVARYAAIQALVKGRFLSEDPEQRGSWRPHPLAGQLLADELERRRSQPLDPVAAPGPRQRPSALAG